ncbi:MULTISPECIES: SMC-Scp complex subunit ScpB [Idiomarina]|jgi:segregation and condensation protein B|uniref:SMC-Scp complex subunit ScpB n=2 Tax=Idiomarina baltica TaxID=190892 RepID=A0A348WLM5_9GAMM|nr:MULTISPECIES: SMC-Scp complex subunit ScpB [Idiomarina]MBL75253.1 SMC-Scp complex subunit ScpB [Idiomarinaceae bacterium]MBR36944.1 SMC-Scp complex subunit ScpB [Idiomarina sp.]EAQ31670.1 Predicted transcriptional regulator containing the HTH domain [Idiomarina baltica OS145]KXS35450.1 MAG: putative transcriptional regulator containing the HTH domain [Idiomarina sp. T82-3]HAE89808.1 SMC-Scp complex subunit ScpB [Idiomarina sp.]|tara:strand:+ start:2026 stop:2592 length:567 start_codon:yes stop_codon:yes gene_type:complete
MNKKQLKQLIEAALFAHPQPLSVQRLYELFEAQGVSLNGVKGAIKSLQDDYHDRGIELVNVASGFRFQTRPEFGELLAGLWQERPTRYSQALLETLALIAYRQPITRGEIEQVRGVSVSSNIIKTLQERQWIAVVGQKEVPGRPQLYGTTAQFLDDFNLTNLSELPSIDFSDETTAETAITERDDLHD